jgi:hypothetical protein
MDGSEAFYSSTVLAYFLSWFCPFSRSIFSIIYQSYPNLFYNIPHTIMKQFTSFLHEIDELIDVGFLHYEGWSFDPEENGSNQVLHIRWISLRSQKTLYELNQILLLAQDTDLLSQENGKLCDKIQSLLSYLRWGKKNQIYMKVLSIVTKYLDGIKRFLSKHRMNELRSYRQLFEWVFIAIIRETRPIVAEIY